MDFGIQIEPQFGFTYSDIVRIGKAGEAAGFSGAERARRRSSARPTRSRSGSANTRISASIT